MNLALYIFIALNRAMFFKILAYANFLICALNLDLWFAALFA